jgi:hypothetical protein
VCAERDALRGVDGVHIARLSPLEHRGTCRDVAHHGVQPRPDVRLLRFHLVSVAGLYSEIKEKQTRVKPSRAIGRPEGYG